MCSVSLLDLELETLMSRPVESAVQSRWERKAAQAQSCNANAITIATETTTPRASAAKTPKTPKTPLNRTSSSSFSSSSSYSDRFIPNRDAMNKNLHSLVGGGSNENLVPEWAGNSTTNVNAASTVPSTSTSTAPISTAQKPASEFQSHLASSLLCSDDLSCKILAFKSKAPKPTESYASNMRVLYTANREQSGSSGAGSVSSTGTKRSYRHIASAPERVLDAPDLTEDYYLNLLDWSCSNLLAVALGSSVYLWDAVSGSTDLLCEAKQAGDLITSVQWMADGSHLAVACGSDVQLWNCELKKQVRSMKGHAARVGSLAWNHHILSSGSRDASIFQHDVRMAQHHIGTLSGHTQEVCGLKWSPDGTQLASGSNDNTACIWDLSQSMGSSTSSPKYQFTESVAAVKALAWCPWQKNLLATGSGTADRHIRFYNTSTGRLENSIDSGSQVCSLQWSRTEKELLSSHGFSQNQLSVWKYPTMAKIADLTGHSSRVLHTAVSPDGSMVCSAAADETIRFWRVWDAIGSSKKAVTDGAAQTNINATIATANATATASKRSMMSINIR